MAVRLLDVINVQNQILELIVIDGEKDQNDVPEVSGGVFEAVELSDEFGVEALDQRVELLGFSTFGLRGDACIAILSGCSL